MKISKEYGPQYDDIDGTIGNLQLVKRYAITDNKNIMICARQGRFTYGTKKEASNMLRAYKIGNSSCISEMFPNGLKVTCFWCYPNHFDPVGVVPC